MVVVIRSNTVVKLNDSSFIVILRNFLNFFGSEYSATCDHDCVCVCQVSMKFFVIAKSRERALRSVGSESAVGVLRKICSR